MPDKMVMVGVRPERHRRLNALRLKMKRELNRNVTFDEVIDALLKSASSKNGSTGGAKP
jgi:hypothetical protein